MWEKVALKEVDIPLTIEGQLERYYMANGHTDRHEVLWHAWNQNRRWIQQLLQMTLSSFPTYSKHDETHAESVIHNIEMILGQERIAELSASDCFMLLHTVYIHDIGMCITYQDREKIIANTEFIRMVEELQQNGDNSFDKAIRALKQTDYSYTDEQDKEVKMKRLYHDKLQVYYAIIHLLANYRRAEHGDVSKERLYTWTLESDKLGSGFSLAGIPLRIFLSIASCAQMHTKQEFESILELPQEDGGFASDYIHPRFISVMLQLGDILDMDNNRFHPLTKECMGDLPEVSEQHFEKHLSIRRLHITTDKISIRADCKTQEALRLVRKECNMLTEILKSAGYYWSIICPPNFKGTLPTISSVELFLQGKKIPEELVSTKFEISQEKAFSILEGSNVYSGRFVFLREFLQNAADASKIQYWKECISTSGAYESKNDLSKCNPAQLDKIVSTDNFPIEIEMEIQKKDSTGQLSPINEKDVEDMEHHYHNCYTYGVKVRIKDFGIGIGKDAVLKIAQVGTGKKRNDAYVSQMPEWLKPTAEFGIGMQSAFLVTDTYKCKTHTRNGERYEITFGSAASKKYEGYINVKPMESFETKEDTFGTCFEIFVPCNKKFLHKDCMAAWNGEDSFSADYYNRKPLRYAAELLSQMAIYLDNQVGELLFPVHLSVKKNEYVDIPLEKNEKNEIKHINFKFKESAISRVKKNTDAELTERIGWLKELGNHRKTKYTVEKAEEEIVQNAKTKLNNELNDNKDNKATYEKILKRASEEDRIVENERKWIKESKAWIYYKEEVKRDYDIIMGEVKNNSFMFDCRSARLYFWDGENNILALCGVQNLLNEEKEFAAHRNEGQGRDGTRIFYKGMELENGREDSHCEFIEYIDIKGGLGRQYINLSRRGFTEEGEKHFKDYIYPTLIQSIRWILKYLAQNCEEKLVRRTKINIKYKCYKINAIKEKIIELEKEDVKDAEWKEKKAIAEKLEKNYQKSLYDLQYHMLAIVMLSYYANKDEDNELMNLGCSGAATKICPWVNLLSDIKTILQESNLKQLLGNFSTYFNLKVYNEMLYMNPEENKNGQDGKTTFLDIFSEKKYAIISKRESSFGEWVHILISLDEGSKVIDKCRELIGEKNAEKRKNVSSDIESWTKKILSNFRNRDQRFDNIYTEDDYKQQRVIKWILHNVPTVAMLANEDGSVRINVLSGKILPFVYLNDNFKILILKRIAERYEKDKILRFSTLVWQGHEYLSCSKLPFHMYFVKRGYLSTQELNKVIFPFDGKDFMEIYQYVAKNDDGELEGKLYMIMEGLNISKFFSNSALEMTLIIANVVRNFYLSVQEFCRNLDIVEAVEHWKNKLQTYTMEELEGEIQEWGKFYIEFYQCIANLKPSALNGNSLCNKKDKQCKNPLQSLLDKNVFKTIVFAWVYVVYYLRLETNFSPKTKQIKSIYNGLLEGNIHERGDKRKRIVEYIKKEGKYPMDEERIEVCLKQFEEEIWELLGIIEKKRYKESEQLLDSEGTRLMFRWIDSLEFQEITKDERPNGVKNGDNGD